LYVILCGTHSAAVDDGYLYFARGYQNNSGIDIFHKKEPTSIGIISTSRIRKRLLEDTSGLHQEGHHEALPGGADQPQP
jgi:hypothetical protein